MRWEDDQDFVNSSTTLPWMSWSETPADTMLIDALAKMIKLRRDTAPIYVKSVFKNDLPVVNGDVR